MQQVSPGTQQPVEPASLDVVAICGAPRPGGAENYFVRFVVAAGNPVHGLAVRPFVRSGSWIAAELAARAIAHSTLPFAGAWDVFTRMRLGVALRRQPPMATISFLARAAQLTPVVPGVTRIARQGGFYDQRKFARMDAHVAISPGIIDHIAAQGVPRSRVHLITNFAPEPRVRGGPDRQSRARFGLPRDAFVWLLAGRLHPNKNVDGALHALNRLPSPHHLLVVGSGPLEAELKALAGAPGLDGRVTFHPWVRDIAGVAAVSDAWLFPSRVEPNGTNVVDAWAYGLPLVTSTASGPAYLATHGETALMVEAGAPSQMADAMARIAHDAGLRARLTQNGADELRRHYGEAATMEKWRSLIASLASTASARQTS